MLYRLRPPADVTWCKSPVRDFLELAGQSGADLDQQLEWLPATDTTMSDDLIRLALRHGVPSKSGIVLDSKYVDILGRADTLRLAQLASDQGHHEVRETSGALMENLLPGWKKHNEELDQRVRESTAPFIQEADEELARALAASPKPMSKSTGPISAAAFRTDRVIAGLWVLRTRREKHLS